MNEFLPPHLTVVDRATLSESAEGLRYRAVGEGRYREGQVAFVTVAGGQGSRLGWRGPKATFPVFADGTTLLAVHAGKIASIVRRYGCSPHWIIMTSAHTHQGVTSFLEEHNHCGLPRLSVLCREQDSLPVLDGQTREPLLTPEASVTAPGGHGGFLTSESIHDTLQQLFDQGVRYLVYNQIDNVLCRYDDRLFVGFAACESADVVLKLLMKESPTERLGTIVHHGGYDRILEYSEIPPEVAESRTMAGSLRFPFGGPSMYCFRLEILLSQWPAFAQLPVHYVRKDIPLSDGRVVSALKGERYIHDALGTMLSMAGFIVDRRDEFAPIKSQSGDESLDDARCRLSVAYQRWLAAVGFSGDEQGERGVQAFACGQVERLGWPFHD
jgi:UDP-N-acetylglucosamine/UDP-N-acetylgalactosamine diphosphorylase